MTVPSPQVGAEHGGVAQPERARILGFDGLRGAAALLVVFHHLVADFFPVRDGWFEVAPSWRPAGFLGVDLFFVMSGYLVATLALDDHESGGRWRGGFYRRRAVRLLPALVALCAVHVAYSRLAGWSTEVEAKSMALIFTGTTNMAPAFSDMALSDGLVPLWTLALEWQFYVVFPLLLAVLPRDVRRHGAPLFAGAAVAVMVWRWHLYESGTPVAELFTRTDSRGDAILVGVALAFVWPMLRTLPQRIHVWSGWLALAAFVTIYLWVDFDQPFLYRGGYTLVAVLAAALLCSIMADAGPASIFRLRPLRAVGLLSYGLYIWHSFVFVAVGRAADGWPRGLQAGTAVVLSFVVALLSWHLVEQPTARYFGRRRSVGTSAAG